MKSGFRLTYLNIQYNIVFSQHMVYEKNSGHTDITPEYWFDHRTFYQNGDSEAPHAVSSRGKQ